MKVVVDTCVWSLALRRNVATEEMAIGQMLRELITDGRVVLLGAIRQEVLSGIRYSVSPACEVHFIFGFPPLSPCRRGRE